MLPPAAGGRRAERGGLTGARTRQRQPRRPKAQLGRPSAGGGRAIAAPARRGGEVWRSPRAGRPRLRRAGRGEPATHRQSAAPSAYAKAGGGRGRARKADHVVRAGGGRRECRSWWGTASAWTGLRADGGGRCVTPTTSLNVAKTVNVTSLFFSHNKKFGKKYIEKKTEKQLKGIVFCHHRCVIWDVEVRSLTKQVPWSRMRQSTGFFR